MKLATDIGGTFTDLVFLDSETGEVGLAKAPSTPPDFDQGIMDSIEKSGLDPRSVTYFAHGTTMVINALTERKGARTALVTTEGCRDVLGIGRGNRPDIYNLRFRKQPAFVPRERRFEVPERMDYLGRVVRELDVEALRGTAELLREAQVESIAICFLHAYANNTHELQAAELLKALLPGIFVTTSSEITREWREYERSSTSVLNAYVAPVAQAYLKRLESELRGIEVESRLDVMKSNGGTQTFALSEQQPIHMVESGPVGGVIGAAEIGKSMNNNNLITMDIGGTTAKCSLIHEGHINVTTDYRIERDQQNAGFPIKVPVVDIVEIGAGGGSIAWIDRGATLKIGPQSAGAVPGPACYGQGGMDPTVTDANLVAGRINPDYFLGGEIDVSIEKARKALAPVANALSVTIDEAALGVIRIANANMINALKLVSVRRGYDPREFSLIAFGGGGAMHAGELAREMRMAQVIIPQAPGHFSAWGMLMTNPVQDFIQTSLMACEADTASQIETLFNDLEREALVFFEQSGYNISTVRLSRVLDMRYLGQEHTVQTPVSSDQINIQQIISDFHEIHERAYTFRLDTSTQIVNFRVAATVVGQPHVLRWSADPHANGAPKGDRSVDFGVWGRRVVPIYERDNLRQDQMVVGPAVVEEPASTTVVLPGQMVEVDAIGNMLLTDTEILQKGAKT